MNYGHLPNPLGRLAGLLCLLVVPLAQAYNVAVTLVNACGDCPSLSGNAISQYSSNGGSSWTTYGFSVGLSGKGGTVGTWGPYNIIGLGSTHIWRVKNDASGEVYGSGTSANLTADLEICDCSPPADTYYTNNFNFVNGPTPFYGVVQVSGGGVSDSFQQFFVSQGSYAWTYYSTNAPASMTIDELDGPIHHDVEPNELAVADDSPLVDVDPTGSGINPTTNINWTGGTNLATESTLRDGFDLLYDSGKQNVASLQTAGKADTDRIVGAIEGLDLSVTIGDTIVTNVGTGEGALNVISNIMRNAGDGGESYSNDAPHVFSGDLVGYAETQTSGVRDEVEGIGDMVSFGKLGSVTAPSMLVAGEIAGFAYSFNMDPASDATLSQILLWIRTFITWAATVYFLYWCVSLALRKTAELFNIPQLAGAGIVGKVLSAGGLLTGFGTVTSLGTLTIFLGGFTAIFLVVQGWFSSFVANHASFLSNLAQTPIGGSAMPAIALYLFSLVVPWDYLLYLLEAAFIFWLWVEASSIALKFTIKAMAR